MSGARTVLCLVTALAALVASPVGARAAWVRPLPGAAVAGFDYDRAHPFTGAQRRGIDFAAPPGAPARAPCPGRVIYAGPVPRSGAGVTVRCGALVATVLRLGTVAVRRGDAVLAGEPLGRAGPAGRVRLGARRAGDRFGYVDPAALLGAGRHPPVPAAPARPRLAPPGVVRPLRTLRPLMPAAVRAGPASAAAPSRAPAAAWAGLALVALALTTGAGIGAARRVRAPASRARSSERPAFGEALR